MVNVDSLLYWNPFIFASYIVNYINKGINIKQILVLQLIFLLTKKTSLCQKVFYFNK
jgi:hypothetical protein